jgi:F-type H+-transporting ATPase subunit gamma
MAGSRDLRRRIRAVKSTEQITQAMKMVAAAKLLRSQERAVAARPFAREIQQVLGRLVATSRKEAPHPLFAEREVKAVAYVPISADRGLCGSYNSNIMRRTALLMGGAARQAGAAAPAQVMLPIGRKARDFYRKRAYTVAHEFPGMGEEVTFALARAVARKLISLFEKGEADEVWLVYTEFINAMQQRTTALKLLPVTPPADAAPAAPGRPEHIYEPSAAEVLTALVPRFVEVQVYRALLEAKASEHGARMTAMGSATTNAKELGEELTLAMNRLRQATITREIAEIVGGAEAQGK